VTQSNAANAEENAAASEELSSQATSLTGIVANLTALVLGGNQDGHLVDFAPERPLGGGSLATKIGGNRHGSNGHENNGQAASLRQRIAAEQSGSQGTSGVEMPSAGVPNNVVTFRDI